MSDDSRVLAVAELVRRAFERTTPLKHDLRGFCGRAALQIMIEASERGIRGVRLVEGDGHAFCRLADGRILDVTATQFNGYAIAPEGRYGRIVLCEPPKNPPRWHSERVSWDSVGGFLEARHPLFGAAEDMEDDRRKVLELREELILSAAERVRRAFERIAGAPKLKGYCGRASLQFLIEAAENGVCDAAIVEGVNHAFCQLSDRRIVDLTAEQFNGRPEAPPDGYGRIIIGEPEKPSPPWHSALKSWESLEEYMAAPFDLFGGRYFMKDDRQVVLETEI